MAKRSEKHTVLVENRCVCEGNNKNDKGFSCLEEVFRDTST